MRQEYMHAFAAVRAAMSFLECQLPLAAHFTEGRVFRENRLLLPPEALRKVILNAGSERRHKACRGVACRQEHNVRRAAMRLLQGVRKWS
jgi:hypothetical protein